MHTFFYSNISEFAGNLEGMLDEGQYRTTVQSMHKLGWKAEYFKSADFSMLGHGCDDSQYPKFYDTNNKKFQRLPRPYVRRYFSEKGHTFFPKPWILALAKSVEIFIHVSINDMPTVKYWQNLERTMNKAKDNTPNEFRIGDT